MATLADVARLESELPEVSEVELREVLLDGWLACAPANLAETFLNCA